MDDAERLYLWRNDPDTRRNSRSQDPLDLRGHEEWLRASLQDPERKIYIVLESGVLVGTVRTDKQDDFLELSWTVAPEARGRGLGREMVLQFRDEVIPNANIQASVRKGNVASEKIAGALGLYPVGSEENSGDPPMVIWK
jgi:RimJ/RimL family protein N-acetyltransferase